MIEEPLAAKIISLKNLLSLTGKLVWAAQCIPNVIRKTAPFWYLIDRFKDRAKSTIITLSQVHLANLHWLASAFKQWSGISFFSPSSVLHVNLPEKFNSSDSSNIGAAFLTPSHYAFWLWCTDCITDSKQDMTPLELAAITIGLVNQFASEARTSMLIWCTDNKAACQAISKGYSSSDLVNSLLDIISKCEITHQFMLYPHWLPRRKISQVDSLTRGSDEEFLAALPKDMPKPKRIYPNFPHPMKAKGDLHVCFSGSH
jgi:hypothetical protein